MPSSKALVAFVFVASVSTIAHAQEAARGYAVERFTPSATGAGWFTQDALDMRGGLGGALGVTGGFAKNPLRLKQDDGNTVSVVSSQAFVDVGAAITYSRFRLSFAFDVPVAISGHDGTAGRFQYTAPHLNFGSTPDALGDSRLGFDVRLLGDAKSSFRLGAGATVFIPAGERSDYVSDGTYRGALRVLFAGESGTITYAGQVGLHLRPHDAPVDEAGAHGGEFLFGIAAGRKFPFDAGRRVFVLGPEITSESAFHKGLASGVEGLFAGRVEGKEDDGAQLRFKAGVGAGLSADFGTPDWRFVVGVEVFDRGVDRDGDGITDSKDACSNEPGPKTENPRTNGCPPRPAASP